MLLQERNVGPDAPHGGVLKLDLGSVDDLASGVVHFTGDLRLNRPTLKVLERGAEFVA